MLDQAPGGMLNITSSPAVHSVPSPTTNARNKPSKKCSVLLERCSEDNKSVCLIRRPEERLLFTMLDGQQKSDGDVYEEEKRNREGTGAFISTLTSSCLLTAY